MVTQYPRVENAHGEEIAAQAGVTAENAGDGLVAIFFVRESVGRSVFGRRSLGLPFRATMFHAVGLNVMDARERKSDDLDVSTRALKDMIDRQTAHVVVENRPEDVADGTCYAHANRSRALLRTASFYSANVSQGLY